MKPKFLDLFAGAGGLSEGFIQAGYNPIMHVEMDKGACFTLKTRLAFHWLNANKKTKHYNSYLAGKISRDTFYSKVPSNIINSVLNEEISEESLPKIFKEIDNTLGESKLDLIIGGPPCQAYSVVGRSRDKNRMKGDKRNHLYKFYAEFLKRYQPKYFVFENVLGLLSANDQDGELYFDKMKRIFNENGYRTEYKIVDSSEYGIPQARKRIILIGTFGVEESFYPELQKHAEKIPAHEVLKDLPKLNAGQGTHKYQPLRTIHPSSYLFKSGIRKPKENRVTWHQARPHIARDLSIYKIATEKWCKEHKRLNYNDLPSDLQTHNNRKSFLDRFKVVAQQEPGHTIVAHISKDGHHYIHPDIEQNRSLTVREAARIQTFPDDFYFESHLGDPSRTSAFRQIGNAVPVLLAKQIATSLKQYF
jgi:DNA (cytosine-5)-methyltransferase 1